MLFSEVKGKTKMEMSMTLPTPEAAEETRKFIKKAGGDSTWDRLAEFLAKESTGKEQFIINRTFHAPIGLMYEMWTNPKHISQWMPPVGFNMEYIRADIRPGGSAFYVMTSKDGMTMYGKAQYLEFQKPYLIVYTQQFCDKNEKVSRHPLAPTWPELMLTTVTFAEEGSDKTRITITWECHGKYTQEELMTFVGAKAGMTGGWSGSFDKLEDYLLEQDK